MPLNLRASDKLRNFNVPVSYRLNDRSGKFRDARNVCSIQERLDTRFGSSRYNAISLGGSIQSLSYFVKANGQQFAIAKVGTTLYSVSRTAAPVAIKTGLSAHTIHRGITDNDRHIISIEEDGLFSWNGTIFSPLGQDIPVKPTVALASGGNLTDATEYRVAITFYASSLGLESNYISRTDANITSESDPVTTANPNRKISITNIPAVADNKFVDQVIIYIRKGNGAYLYAGEVSLGETTFEISEDSLSAQTPPLANGAVRPGGGKYLVNFNSKNVYSGNSEFPNEVYFSEENLPDAYDPTDEQFVIPVKGKGPVTGLAVGLFGDSVLDPFLVIFKQKSTTIYSEIGGIPKLVAISDEIGCVSHDTIQVKNGVVYFLSDEGWRAISNGRLVTNREGDAITLGNGDIDDIFKSTGFEYEVNRQTLSRAFSVYYPTLDQYFTWVSEGANYAFKKAYVYEFEVGGFKPYEFAVPATCAILGENPGGRDMVLFGTADGYILQHSIMERRSDVNSSNAATAINAFAVLPWMPDDGDFDATYNFRELILKAIVSSHPLTIRTFLDYNISNSEEGEFNFSDPVPGFVLDEDALDVGTLGDGRSIVTARSDINRTGETIAIGFYQSILDANMGLVSMQIDSSKNGNRNLSRDNGDEEGGFDYEEETYLPSVSDSVQEARNILQQIQSLIGNLGNVAFLGYSARFDEMWDSDGVEDTFSKILQIEYAGPQVSLATNPAAALREKGTVVSSIILNATITKRSNDIDKARFYRNGVEINEIDPATPGGAVESYTDNDDFSDTVSFYAEVDDVEVGGNQSTVQSNVVTHTFVYPYYHGAGAVGLSAAAVAALTKSVIASNANLNRSFTSSNGDVYYYAYPASYGALTSILDENGFETFADWTLRTENITGLDGNAVSYRIYEFNNPVVAGSTDYTFIR